MINKINAKAALIMFAVILMFYSGDIWAADDSKQTADVESKNIWTRTKLSGDWYGLRSDLAKHGIDFDFRLSQYYQGVTSGGANTNDAYGGTMDYRLNLDGQKLGLWKGFTVNMHARSRFGQDVNADAGPLSLQNAGMLMPAPGDYHGTNITGLMGSYTFPFVAGRLGNVTVGKFDVIDLVTGFFPNVGYGQEGFMNANSMVTALPWFGSIQGLSLYGGLALSINQEYKITESGFLACGTENVSTSWGSVSDSFDDGVFLGGFHRFFWGDPDDKIGYLMVFGGGSTKDQASNDPHDFVFIPGQGIENTVQHKSWDIALYLYQEFWKDKSNPNRKANFMIGGTVGPDNPQFAQYNCFANVEAFGLNKSRPKDRMGVGGFYNQLSNEFEDLTSIVDIELESVWGTELYYNAEITPSFHLTPNLQFVNNANQSDSTAVILGVRAVIDF